MDVENTDIYRTVPELNQTPASNTKVVPYTVPFAWSDIDTRNAALLSVLPLGVAFVKTQAISSDPVVVSFLQCESPAWMPRNPKFYSITNMLIAAPLGYASYIVFKMGGGFTEDTRLPLTLYGITMAGCLVGVSAKKSLDVNKIAIASTISASLASATAYAFYKVDNTAGYWTIPMAVWDIALALPWLYRIWSGKPAGGNCAHPSDLGSMNASEKVTHKTVKVQRPMASTGVNADGDLSQENGDQRSEQFEATIAQIQHNNVAQATQEGHE